MFIVGDHVDIVPKSSSSQLFTDATGAVVEIHNNQARVVILSMVINNSVAASIMARSAQQRQFWFSFDELQKKE